MTTPRMCTLTLTKDGESEYEDDGIHRRDRGRSVRGELGSSRLARDVVTLLSHWVATNQRCRRDELMVLGKALYEIAFGPAPTDSSTTPRTAFEDTIDECRGDNRTIRFRLVLDTDDKVLAGYPWEFLFLDDPNGAGFFLAGQNTKLTLTRYVPNSDPWDQTRTEDTLRILVVESTPKIPELPELSVGGFVEYLGGLDQTRFTVSVVKRPTRPALRAAIAAAKPHVVHFIGHGQQGALSFQKDPAVLAADRAEWEDARAAGRNPPEVSEAEWADAVTASDVLVSGNDIDGAPRRLIFLHACEGATATETQAILGTFNDVARTLARKPQITGVIAMQYTITVEEAELFAKTFYSSICDGARVDDAIREAREVFTLLPLRGQQSWDSRGFGTPVSYLRREEPLINRPPENDRPPPPAVTVPPPQSVGAAVLLPCPNGRCPDGKVLPNARVPRCRVCSKPYAQCPSCEFLIVTLPGYQCLNCDYTFGDPSPAAAAAPVGSDRRPFATEAAPGHQLPEISTFSTADARLGEMAGARVKGGPNQASGRSPEAAFIGGTEFLGQSGPWHGNPAHSSPEEGGTGGRG